MSPQVLTKCAKYTVSLLLTQFSKTYLKIGVYHKKKGSTCKNVKVIITIVFFSFNARQRKYSLDFQSCCRRQQLLETPFEVDSVNAASLHALLDIGFE